MNYRREIDGLRALAVVPVILFLAGFDLFRAGFVGVDVFFVISGYLITTLILADVAQGKFSLAHFYVRRARRILPALFLVIAVCLVLSWFLLLPSDMNAFLQSVMAATVFGSNILFWRESGYFESEVALKPLLHTWSLSVEEQFYLLFPLCLVCALRFGKRGALCLLVVFAVCSIALAYWGAFNKPAAAFYLLPTRGWELLIGAIAAFYLSHAPQARFGRWVSEAGAWLGLLLIAAAVFGYARPIRGLGLPALAPTIGTALIILFGTQQTSAGRFIGNQAFVGVGLISYSAYLWHQPLFAFARHGSVGAPSQTFFAMLIFLTFVLAYASWRYVETPFRQGSRIARPQVLALGYGMAAFFILFGAFGYMSAGYAWRFDDAIRNIESARADKNPSQAECYFMAGLPAVPDGYCRLGKGPVVGMLMGDSHADTLAFPLSNALGERGVSFLSAAYGGCPPIENLYRPNEGRSHKCYEFNRRNFDFVLNNPAIESVVLMARWTAYSEGTFFDNGEGGVESLGSVVVGLVDPSGQPQNTAKALRKAMVLDQFLKSIQKLVAAGKQVFLIYPVPEVGYDVPSRRARLKFLENSDDIVTTRYDLYQSRHADLFRIFDYLGEHKNLVRIKPNEMLCDRFIKGQCVTEIAGKILYYNDDHLSNAGSQMLADEIVKYLRER